jgi:hypothetical protein
MTQNKISENSYTNHPLQHPDFLLGNLQLLFWLIFRPSAWKNRLQNLPPSRSNRFKLFVLILMLISLFTWVVFQKDPWLQVLVCIVTSVAIGVPFTVAFELAVGMAASMVYGIAYGESIERFYGVIVAFVVGLIYGIAYGVTYGVVIDISVGLTYGIVMSLAVGVAAHVSQNVAIGVSVGIAGSIGLLVNWWRPIITAALLIPWNALLYQLDLQQSEYKPSLFSKNLAFWDEWQYFPIRGLDRHLLLILDKYPIEGEAAFEYLSNSHQRWAVQSVQIELDTRLLKDCDNALAVGQIQQILTIRELASPAKTMFHSFNSISVDVDVALRQSGSYNQCLALTRVTDRLNNLVRDLTTSSNKYAVRFRPIAQRWQNIIDLHLQELIKESEERQQIDSPYIIGVPVTNRQQLFVGRTDISEKLENLLLDRRSPPLLLYGQRRTGKTSLLNNLGRLLPTSIIPLFVDLQGSISSAKDHTGFLYNLAKGMINSAQRQRNLKLPPLSYETLATDPFTRFDEWLDNLETALAGSTALLALDEFEVLDHVLRIGRFNEADVLGMLRNLIQHRPKFKVLISGSHTLNEYQHWSSYLINAQVIHIGYLKESETRQLIEQPIDNFALRYEPPASQRVIDITRGHPLFVQLLCAEIVALKNDQDPSIRRLATLADVEAAIPAALEHGSMFFSDIEGNQLDTHSLKVLRYFAQQGEGAIISSTDLAAHFTERAEIAESISGSIELLLRRELIETKHSGYSIQLELIRRWFI